MTRAIFIYKRDKRSCYFYYKGYNGCVTNMINRKHSTKDYITIALYYLMSKYDYDSITVTDICAKARVSRMSFYRYFNNKEDIFINYCDERFEEFFSSIKEKGNIDVLSFLIEIFIFLKKYARQVTVLKKANKENLIVEKFTDYGSYLAKHIDLTIDNNPMANRIIAAFLAGGVANVLLLWFELGLDVPPKEMAEMAYNIFRGLSEKSGLKSN